MSRPARIALDLALISLGKVQPVVTKAWDATKTFVTNTPAKPIVVNPLVSRIETSLDKIFNMMITNIEAMRDRQYEGELRYLQKEIEKIKNKMGQKGGGCAVSKSIKPVVATSWQYAKVELVPPLTGSFFKGPGGQKLEQAVGGFGNGIINFLEQNIKKIDAEELRKVKEKEALIEAEKKSQLAKADAKKKEDEKKRAEVAQKAAASKTSANKEVKAEKKLDKKAAAPSKQPEKKPAKAEKPKAVTPPKEVKKK